MIDSWRRFLCNTTYLVWHKNPSSGQTVPRGVFSFVETFGVPCGNYLSALFTVLPSCDVRWITEVLRETLAIHFCSYRCNHCRFQGCLFEGIFTIPPFWWEVRRPWKRRRRSGGSPSWESLHPGLCRRTPTVSRSTRPHSWDQPAHMTERCINLQFNTSLPPVKTLVSQL